MVKYIGREIDKTKTNKEAKEGKKQKVNIHVHTEVGTESDPLPANLYYWQIFIIDHNCCISVTAPWGTMIGLNKYLILIDT